VAEASRKLVIGLAGGIGSGKSTVATLMAEHGVAVIDSDRLNNEQLCEAEVVSELVRLCGEGIRDSGGNISRDKLARLIFDDPHRRRQVEEVLHPRIARRRAELIERYQADRTVRAIALDSPLLYEVGLDQACDVVVFVDAPAAEREARVAAGRGWPAEELARRERSQEPLDIKGARADYTLVNNSGMDDLRSKVERLLLELLGDLSPG
jgi:dephospho-CoA kinase